MPKNDFKVTDTFTGKETYFPNYDAWITSMDGKVDKKVKEKIFEPLSPNTADENSAMGSVTNTSIDYRTNGDSDTSFPNGGENVKAAAGKLDQAADEYASKFNAQPKTIGGMLGLAMGRAYKGRLDKIEAAGGKEAFQSAKRQKRSEATMRTVGKAQSILGVGTYGKDKKQQRKESRAIAKEKKRFTPMSKMQTMQVDKPSLRNALGKIGNVPLTNQKEVKGLPTKGKYGI
jgi:hypothetical protein